MIPSGTKAIFFDAVGTVLHPEPGAPTVYARVAEINGLDANPKTILERFRAAYLAEEKNDEGDGWRTTETRERERWQMIVRETLPGSSVECFERLFEHFAKPESWAAASDAEVVFDQLAQRGFVLGLASNYDERLMQVLAGRPELKRLGNHVLISSQLGVRKPGQEFFQHILRRVGCSPEAIVFVGDDIDNDYHGAEEAGMTAILLDPRDRHPHIPKRIRTLAELL